MSSLPPLNKDEEHALKCIDELARKGLPLVPMSLAVRSGFKIDKASKLLETLRTKGYIASR